MAAAQCPSKLCCAVALSAVLVCAGCQLEPQLLSASSRTSGSDQIVTVTIQAADAAAIKRRQLYTWLVVASCDNPSDKFPSEPSIAGHRVPEFRFPVSGETADLVSRVPTKIYSQFQHPCAFLEGGGYFTGKIKSSLIAISGAKGTAPNNSFKVTPDGAPQFNR